MENLEINRSFCRIFNERDEVVSVVMLSNNDKDRFDLM